MSDDTVCEVIVTGPTGDAMRELSRAVVNARLAASANIWTGPVESTYWWQGRLEVAKEIRVHFLTRAALVQPLAQFVRDRHPYELPNVTAVMVGGGSAEFLCWVREETASSGGVANDVKPDGGSLDAGRLPTRDGTALPTDGPVPQHSVSVAAAVINTEGRFLAVRRADNGHWEPPGGMLELHESIEEGLVREVAEETGLRVEPLALTGVYKNIARGVVAIVFRCTIAGGRARPTTEALEVAWLTRDDLSQRMNEAYRVRLIDAVDLPGPHVRAHDGVKLV